VIEAGISTRNNTLAPNAKKIMTSAIPPVEVKKHNHKSG
jgi:hypothetical protein